jgi:type II secretory pathway component GspD/PulD (secretin)
MFSKISKIFIIYILICGLSFGQVISKSIQSKNLEPSKISYIFGQSYILSSENPQIERPYNPSPIPLPNGVSSILGIDNLSIIIVQGTESGINDLIQLINIFDVAPKNIEIEAKLLTLSSDNLNKIGLNFKATNGFSSINGVIDESTPSSLFFMTNTGNFFNIIKILGRQNNIKSSITQSITTQSGIPANISFSRDIPIWMNGAIVVNNNSIVLTRPTISFASVITSLNVIANVVGKYPMERINLILLPKIQEVIGFTEGFGGQKVPIVNTFTLSTKVNIKSGDDLIVGGIRKSNNQKIGMFNQLRENTETILIIRATAIVN